MKFNFKRLFDNKRFLMFFSLVIAIIAWTVVVIAVDPNTTEVREVTVDFSDVQTQMLDPMNLRVVDGESLTVKVEIEGKRYIVKSARPEDIKISPTLSGITSPGTYNTIPLTGMPRFNQEFTIKSVTPNVVTVRIDRDATRKFAVSTNIEGLVIPDVYLGSDPIVTPREVTISGPEADINKIDKCVVTARFTNPLTASKTVSSEITLYDSDGNVIDKNLLRMDSETADITIPVLKQKSLPVVFKYQGLPPGFPEDPFDFKLSVGEIKVAGPEALVDKYDKLDIGYVYLNEIEPDKVFEFPISLPSGMQNVENVDVIRLAIDVDGMQENIFNVSNIQTVNLPVNYNVAVDTSKIANVRMMGDPEVMETLSAQDIIAEIDLSERELTPGPYNLPVRISVPGKKGQLVWAVGEYKAVVTIREKK